MDFKLNREELICSVPVMNTEISQAAEHDFILPDYCPDIFRVLKCCMLPSITSTGINGSRLTFDLSVIIRVIYRTSENSGIYCIEEHKDYSKTIELPADTINPYVKIEPITEYVNCRVASQRRLDVRGNICCKVKAEGEKKLAAVCAAFGNGIRTRTKPVCAPCKRLISAKRITVIEELELPSGKPQFGSIVRCGACVKKGEQKIVSGKIVSKGEAEISMLYLPKDPLGKPPEQMKFSIPFSQIIDMDGIDEAFTVETEISASECSILPKSEDTSAVECELVMLVNIKAVKYETHELVSDTYSTMYECTVTKPKTSLSSERKRLSANFETDCTLSSPDGNISRVYDMWCENAFASARFDKEKNCVMLCGKVVFCMLCTLNDDTPAYIEKESIFEKPLECGDMDTAELTCECSVTVNSSSYTMTEEGVSGKALLFAECICENQQSTDLIENIEILTDRPKERDKKCAVKICFSEQSEDLWETAKKYSTDAEAILEENSHSDSDGRRILIIPMKN